MSELQKHNLKEDVLSVIEAGEAVMRPRWHFVLGNILTVLGIVFATVAAVYLMSFIAFTLRESGIIFTPAFGMRGMGTFLLTAPWVLITIAGLLLVVLEILVRRYSFSYRKPLLYTMLGIVLFSLAGSYAVAKVGIQERLQSAAERGELPLMGRMYARYERDSMERVHRGVIIEVTEAGFALKNRREELFVNVSDATRFPGGREFSIGDHVVVLGERTGEVIEAVGVRKAPEGRGGMMRGMGGVR